VFCPFSDFVSEIYQNLYVWCKRTLFWQIWTTVNQTTFLNY